MNGFLSRRGLLGGMFGACVALLKGVSVSPARGDSAETVGTRSPNVASTTTYNYDPRTGELASSSTYDEQGRIVMYVAYGGESVTRTSYGAVLKRG